jgi:hypothetical protein
MKAISLHQPWAAAVAVGIKWIETRSWRTHYRGPLAIHAAKTKSTDNLRAYYEVITPRAEDLFMPLNYADLPFGYIIATDLMLNGGAIAAAEPTSAATGL